MNQTESLLRCILFGPVKDGFVWPSMYRVRGHELPKPTAQLPLKATPSEKGQAEALTPPTIVDIILTQLGPMVAWCLGHLTAYINPHLPVNGKKTTEHKGCAVISSLSIFLIY